MFKSGGICYTKKKKRPGRAGNGVVIFMDSNRVMLKADARRRTVSCQPSPILAGLILFAIGMLISTLTSYLMGMDRLATALTDAAVSYTHLAASEPAEASVRPKAKTLPAAARGRYFCFCSSLP